MLSSVKHEQSFITSGPFMVSRSLLVINSDHEVSSSRKPGAARSSGPLVLKPSTLPLSYMNISPQRTNVIVPTHDVASGSYRKLYTGGL